MVWWRRCTDNIIKWYLEIYLERIKYNKIVECDIGIRFVKKYIDVDMN